MGIVKILRIVPMGVINGLKGNWRNSPAINFLRVTARRIFGTAA